MKTESPPSRYDQNEYYDANRKGARLAPALNAVLYVLDWQKAFAVSRQVNLAAKSKATRRVLDIGAGDGKFLYFMRGFGCQIFGTTASRVSQRAAQDNFGVELEFATEIPASLAQGRYHLLTYWHVFEHLTQPEDHVRLWRDLVSPDGWVVIEVPNVESLGAKWSFEAWLGSDLTHHCNHMRERDIASLAARHGLQVVKREGFSWKFTYPFLWSSLLGALFGARYTFDSIFGILKSPLTSLRRRPLVTINGLLAAIYLAPLIGCLALFGLWRGRGEILRLYLRPALN